MAFIVQGDVPLMGANAYIPTSFFRQYWEDRGVDPSEYTDRDIEVSIIKGSQYLDLRFKYVGHRYSSSQELEWPRQFAYDNEGNSITGLPLAVKQATSEYAKRSLTLELLADPLTDISGRPLKSKEETVGPISEKYEYEFKGLLSLPEYPQADRILISKGLVTGGLSPSQTGGLSVGNLGRA